jgi:putative ABC transport system permease protein
MSAAAKSSTFRFGATLRFALRDLRGGLSGFGVFLACIALGVAAIVGVGSTSRGLSDGLAAEGRRILGGDVSYSLNHREASAEELAFLRSRGRVGVVATQRAMARADGRSTLVEIKAVDESYPMVGALEIAPPSVDGRGALDAASPRVYAEPALLAKLDVQPGARMRIGDLEVALAARLVSEPDKLAGGIGFGPRVLMTIAALKATGLVQPGSLTRWTYRVVLPDGASASDAAIQALTAELRARFPEAGFEARGRGNVSAQFERNLERFAQFLTLVGLTALVVGGVGVANAASAFVERKRADMATLKSLGATGGRAVSILLTEAMLIAGLGVALGLAVGAAIPFLVALLARGVLPFPLAAAVYPRELALGALYGGLAAFAFSVVPLGRAHDAPVVALFRDGARASARWPKPRYVLAAALAGAALVGAAAAFSGDPRLALIYAGATLGAFALLRLVAWALMALARRAPRPRATAPRLALSNIYRPGALTPSVVLSLGLGLTLLVALAVVESNVSGQLRRGLPGRTPSFFFLDVRSQEAHAFADFLKQEAPDGVVERTPMMRGRITRVKDVPSEQVAAAPDAAWALEGDRGVTYAANLPAGSTLAKGAWWAADYSGPPLVSMEQGVARGLGLDVGDAITVNVLGRPLTARIANLRQVDWRSFGINFVLVFSPSAFRGAPHTELATIALPGPTNEAREMTLLKRVGDAYPAVVSVRVREALDAADAIVAQIAAATRGAASIAVLASILVLSGALAAGRGARIYDAVVLKTLGATRRQLVLAYLIEYGLIGLATAMFGLAAGTLAGEAVAAGIMKLDVAFEPGPALAAAGAALALTMALGLIGAWRVLGESPARRLRAL